MKRFRVYLLSLLAGAAAALLLPHPRGLNDRGERPWQAPDLSPAASRSTPQRSLCSEPLPVRISAIDPQFRMQAEQANAHLLHAVKEWEDATGRKWFVLSESGGGVSVNFLFDGRQEVLMLQAREEQEIEAEIAALQQNHRAPSQAVDALLDRLEQYRRRREQLRTPTPWAQYVHTQAVRAIDVFAFSDEEQLHAILLHELGHALGLGHLPQPEAIMHALRETGVGDVHLSRADVEAALALCLR